MEGRPWLMFGIGSAIPWRETRLPLVARPATLPFQGRL